jgi:hypothetical protein
MPDNLMAAWAAAPWPADPARCNPHCQTSARPSAYTRQEKEIFTVLCKQRNPVLRNRNYFLQFRFWFQLLTSLVRVPVPYLDHKKHLKKFASSVILKINKIDKFHQTYCKM